MNEFGIDPIGGELKMIKNYANLILISVSTINKILNTVVEIQQIKITKKD